jgi:hypothetical protein
MVLPATALFNWVLQQIVSRLIIKLQTGNSKGPRYAKCNLWAPCLFFLRHIETIVLALNCEASTIRIHHQHVDAFDRSPSVTFDVLPAGV